MIAISSRDGLLALVLLALTLLVAYRFPGFIAPTNLASVFNDTALLIILALGQMVVIVTRAIDLSVAANLALSGMVAAMVSLAYPDLPMGVIVLLAVLCGAAVGAINGALVWLLKIPPIVVTLGTMTIWRGVIFLLTDGKWINAHEMSPAFKEVPRLPLLGLPLLSWIALLTVAAFGLYLNRAPSGRALFAAGGNPNAALYAGVNPGRMQALAFLMSGTLAGLAGYLWVARYAVAYVDIAGGFELDVVAACVIGGVAIAGGAGTVLGTVLGALFIGVIKNALPVIGVSPFWQMAISGSAILIAIVLNARATRAKGKIILRETP
jgi:rhamnose transport system permease protein